MDFNQLDESVVGDYLKEMTSKFANLIFSQQTYIEAHLYDGSVKAAILVAGFIYVGVCQYGSFRSGIDHIINDSKLLKEVVVNEQIKNGLDGSHILRIKRLHCVPDKIKRVLSRIERLESNFSNLSQVEQKKELISIKTAVKDTYSCLNDEKDQALFLESFDEKYFPEIANIPSKERTKQILFYNKIGFAREN